MMMVALLAAVAGLGASCGSSGTAEPAAEVVDVTGIDPVRDAFVQDRGSTRLLLLLSPT